MGLTFFLRFGSEGAGEWGGEGSVPGGAGLDSSDCSRTGDAEISTIGSPSTSGGSEKPAT